MNKYKYLIYWAVVFPLIFGSCTKEEDDRLPEVRKEYCIAVVLPHSNNQLANWHRSIDWAVENLNAAMESRRGIRITTEWFDQEKHDLQTLFYELAQREDISAILGPVYSSVANIAAGECSKTGKTLIAGTVSSELLMRKYAQKKFFWCLAENDISQCEILLSKALQKGAKTVSLLTSTDEYGTTYWDWFSFQARELGLEVVSMQQYNTDDLELKMRGLIAEEVDCLICIPNNQSITGRMNEIRNQTTGRQPFLLFSDVAVLSQPDISMEGMEGIIRTFDPSSGFHINYSVRYGMEPQFGSAQYYDAAILAGLGILEADLEGESNINDALCRIVDGQGRRINCNTIENVDLAVKEIIERKYPKIAGATGDLKFDEVNYTNVLHSIYSHWVVYNGNYLTLEYSTSDENNRTSTVAANWNWKATLVQDFSESGTYHYPMKTGAYALIIATSSGWNNYRHQANAYEMYQLLKANGFDDEQIILIAEDDIANNTMNPYPGKIFTSVNGINVYENIRIDHKLSEIKLSDLYDLLTDETGKGISIGDSDNLFIYWCGHGSSMGPVWQENLVLPDEISTLFQRLADEERFRKVLFAIETCFSGLIGLECEGIPGLLCLTAANELETSKVSRFSTEMNIWMSNSFSEALIEQLAVSPDMAFNNLYRMIYNRTIGSHVSVYNAPAFDNLHNASPREFIYP